MSAHDAAILRLLAQMDARQKRIEALLARVLGGKDDPAEHDLLQMIAAIQGQGGFWAKELWATVQAMRAAAEASGEPIPDIAQAFEDLGLASVKSLGRWLAAQDPSVVERSEKTRDGILWQVVT